MVFKMALLLVLEKKEMYLYFQLENILRLFEVMKMIFKKCVRIVKGGIQLDIHDVCRFCY